MKTFIRSLSLILFLVLFAAISTADAQYYGKKKKKKKKKPTTEKTTETTTDDSGEYFDDKGTFTQNLWYGADFTLNFGAVQGGNAFVFGFSPMTGYKFNDFLSAGPRIEFFLQSARWQISNTQDVKLNSVDYGLGIFARASFLQSFFVHLEVQQKNEESPLYDDRIVYDTDFKAITKREWNTHTYGGLGYQSSMGMLGFHAYLLWDFSQQLTSTNIPLSYRVGVNYNF